MNTPEVIELKSEVPFIEPTRSEQQLKNQVQEVVVSD